MNRKTVTTGLALVALAIPATPALASTKSEKAQNKQIKKLKHDVKVLSSRIKGIVGCMQYVNLTQYGNASTGEFGYLYTSNSADPTATAATTAIDATLDGDVGTPFLIIAPECFTGGRSMKARAFGSTIVPSGHLAREARGD